jgi:hypothetical protein
MGKGMGTGIDKATGRNVAVAGIVMMICDKNTAKRLFGKV